MTLLKNELFDNLHSPFMEYFFLSLLKFMKSLSHCKAGGGLRPPCSVFNHVYYDTCPAPAPALLISRCWLPRRCTPLCWQYEPIAKLDDINVIYWSTNLSHANEIYFHLITINIFPQLEIFLNCVLFSEFERRPSGARSSIALHKGWTQLRPGYTLQLFTTKNGENVNNCKNISFQKAQLTLAKPRSPNRWHTAGDGGAWCYGTISELNK